jgi:carbonic anhydrase/acetyltransferase-like protein (isoleucine patch superfamily)
MHNTFSILDSPVLHLGILDSHSTSTQYQLNNKFQIPPDVLLLLRICHVAILHPLVLSRFRDATTNTVGMVHTIGHLSELHACFM